MADIFSILGQAVAPRNALSGTSIDDLDKHLRGLLDAKVSPQKAERLSFTFEITSSAKFTVSVSQSENDALEGFARSSEGPDGAQVSRVIAANNTIMNQPQDNPILQRIVAKHIIGAVGACDGSSWAVREVSRGAQGWSFTYICKDSMQSWRRQNAKSMEGVVVGDYTEKERDPVSSSRPAFDCYGSVVISFSRGSRNITVKYKHTPFHKTVAELYDHFAPPPPPVPLVTTTTPKAAKSSRKRDGPNGAGGGSSRKKSRKSTGAAGNANGEGAADDSVVDGQPDSTPQAKPKRKRQYKKKNKEAPASEQEQQGGSSQAVEGGGGDAAAHLHSIVNVDAEEAARRRNKATQILTDAGVDPETLSADQFNIFANQSPALQQESLAMLVEYGAERLRIVHPNKDASAQNAGQDKTAAAASALEASTVTGTQEGASGAATEAPASRTKGQRVTRGSCSNCRGQKGVKCGREKPACQNCVDAGLDCSYPLQRSRPKKPKGDDEETEGPNETSMMDDQHEGDTTQMSFGDATMNLVDLPTTGDQLRPDLSVDHDEATQLDGHESSNETHMQRHDQDIPEPAPEHNYPPPVPPQPEPQPESYQEPVAAPRPKSRSKSQGSRRSLPVGRKSLETSEPPQPVVPGSPEMLSWGTVNPSSLGTASQSRSRQTTAVQPLPASAAQTKPRGYQDMQHVAALSNAALQSTQSPHTRGASIQQQARRSPSQAPATASNSRAASRQSHRGQSRTPLQNTTPLGRPGAAASHAHPPAQQSASPAQPPPASSAPYQYQTSVSSMPAVRSRDQATYEAASSLSEVGNSGLGNYGFGNVPSQSESEQSSRIGYEPYSNHPGTANQPYTTSYDNNFSRPSATNMRMPTTSAQTNTSSYTASSSMSNSRWPSQGTSLQGSSTPSQASHTSHANQTQNTQTNFNRNASQNSSSNPYAQTQSNSYAQKPQTQAPTYNPQQNHVSAGHQQRPHQQHQQQNWYGLGGGAGAGAGSDYHTRGQGYVSGSYAQQGMGMGYGGENDLIDLLGSVHHRP